MPLCMRRTFSPVVSTQKQRINNNELKLRKKVLFTTFQAYLILKHLLLKHLDLNLLVSETYFSKMEAPTYLGCFRWRQVLRFYLTKPYENRKI